MTKLIAVAAAACFILACNNDSTKSAAAKEDSTAKVETASTAVDYPYKPDYTIAMRTHSYWQVKNNKIAGWSEFQQKLAATMPAMK